jgi:hypothetical protein
VSSGGGLLWRWRLEDRRLKAGAAGPRIASLLEEASGGMAAADFYARLEEASGPAQAARMWKILRQGGLVLLPSSALD